VYAKFNNEDRDPMCIEIYATECLLDLMKKEEPIIYSMVQSLMVLHGQIFDILKVNLRAYDCDLTEEIIEEELKKV
jgi:hypothetical protein